VAAKPRFTRIPKTTALVQAGVPADAISTYCCLADYANNKTGLCWPKMETLAQTLNRSVRTVQRHLHLLKELGLIEFITRRRNKGRFSSYLYKICFLATTGHGGQVGGSRSNKRRTRRLRTTPKSPSNSVKDGYHWLFGEDPPPDEQKTHDAAAQKQREEEAKRRREGFEWFFNK
jgi:DNA-binding transcriptional MocR family regulator